MQRFDSTKFYVRKPSRKFGAIEPPFAALRCPHCGKTEQRSGSIAPNFLKGSPSKKFGAIEPPFTVLIVGKGSGSIAPNFLKGSPSENLVLSNRPLFVVSVCYVTQLLIAPNFMETLQLSAVQRFDSTKFSEILCPESPPENLVLSNRPSPPFAVLIVGKGSGSIAPNFLKGSPSENLVLSNRPSPPFAVLIVGKRERKPFWCYRTALRCPHCWKRQRFDSTKFSERKPFRKFGAIEPPPFCCQCLLWMTEQRSGSIAPNFMKGNPPENLVLSNRPSPPFAVLIVGKRSGSIAPNFLKGSPSENLVLSNRPLFVVSVCYG